MRPLPKVIENLLTRELESLRREIELYPDEASIWATPPGVPNSAGNLVLHLAGNLRHYLGANLGESGYVRDRDAEFSGRGLSRSDLLGLIDAATDDVRAALRKLSEARLGEEYPERVRGLRLVTGEFLLHLGNHLAYHLGQVDYHRRIVTGDSAGVGAVSLDRLLGPDSP
jgi:uncharacterized damage-inducible protein DinB